MHVVGSAAAAGGGGQTTGPLLFYLNWQAYELGTRLGSINAISENPMRGTDNFYEGLCRSLIHHVYGLFRCSTTHTGAAERLIDAFSCQSEIVTGRKVFVGKGKSVEMGKLGVIQRNNIHN